MVVRQRSSAVIGRLAVMVKVVQGATIGNDSNNNNRPIISISLFLRLNLILISSRGHRLTKMAPKSPPNKESSPRRKRRLQQLNHASPKSLNDGGEAVEGGEVLPLITTAAPSNRQPPPLREAFEELRRENGRLYAELANTQRC
ncbi:hypothetical protein TYRP_022893 [Tyrophagus putrescentiae]|nr:hypothetical protein TYRP_022893 [Tyrophagus putrescentiae]